MSSFVAVSFITALGVSFSACGGSTPPPEPPEAAPAPPPAEAPATSAPESGDGEHTMPDGSKMPGAQHDHDHQK